MKIKTVFEIVGSICKVEERGERLYIETPIVADTLKKLYEVGFRSLTDCFVTKDKKIYFQLTNYLTKETVFATSKYYIDIFDDDIRKLHPNYIAYEAEIKQYFYASQIF